MASAGDKEGTSGKREREREREIEGERGREVGREAKAPGLRDARKQAGLDVCLMRAYFQDHEITG